jgi:hypothetical protein
MGEGRISGYARCASEFCAFKPNKQACRQNWGRRASSYMNQGGQARTMVTLVHFGGSGV